jgi:hypothetical protein
MLVVVVLMMMTIEKLAFAFACLIVSRCSDVEFAPRVRMTTPTQQLSFLRIDGHHCFITKSGPSSVVWIFTKYDKGY